MKLFPLHNARLRVLNGIWRHVFTSLRTVIPPGLGVIHLAALSNGNEDPPMQDAQRRPLGLMQIPQRLGKQMGYSPDDLKKTSNNVYAWAKLTNKNARDLYTLHPTFWTAPTYDFWLVVHLWFLLQSSFNTLWNYAKPTTTNTDHVLDVFINWVEKSMPKAGHVGSFDYLSMVAIMRHMQQAALSLVVLDGRDRPTAAFGAEVTTPSRGSIMTVLQTSVS